jgi:hypothetical protein
MIVNLGIAMAAMLPEAYAGATRVKAIAVVKEDFHRFPVRLVD